MKKFLWTAVILLAGVFTVSLLAVTFAQEQQAEQAPQEELEYSGGTVKSISDEQIVLTEQDAETGQEVEVAYKLNPGVELDSIGSLAEITAGTNVEIEYVVENDEKIAKVIGLDAEEAAQEGQGDPVKKCE
ncbi:MAG: hypothetical protein PHS93_06680 [Candidatus Omnitrophica bacterium]|nr:hypothetical protein [Candidatus Omnitrophota bacterium]MDD5352834.1 hypothetical protein [Candidatus Omnitrophota bacterium]MDD5550433.1 hypothetical protein [Candidatus Omnitrophota bacterium]